MALPVLLGIGAVVATASKWILEFVYMYGRKIVFFVAIVATFYATLYVISMAVFEILNTLNVSSALSAMSGGGDGSVNPTSIITAVFPTNFIPLVNLIIALEFQILFWRWANKVLDLKVDFFG